MEEKLVTVAIYTFEKAQILKTILESEGIEVFIHNVNLIQPVISSGVRVRIKESDLTKALNIIESTQFFKDYEEYRKDKIKKVLIPIDFSSYSKHACELGMDYAHIIGAEVMFLHVYYSIISTVPFPIIGFRESRVEDGNPKKIYENVKSDVLKIIDGFKHKIEKGELPDVKFDYTIREGIPEDEILSFVKEYKPSIIIMGTRGKSKKSEDLIGSVTAEIIESARNLPILAIPENFLFSKLREVKNIGFATSFKQQDLVLFSRFVNLIEGFKPTIHLFNISTSKNEWNEIRLTGTREYLRKQYPELDIQSTVLDDGNLLDSIDKFVKKSNIGIMTLCTNKRSLITRIFNPSIARKMVFHASTGLLVIPREYN